MKSQPHGPHINQYNTHRNTRINNLILMMQNPNLGWDFHIPPDRRMVEPNLFSSIHPCAIFQNGRVSKPLKVIFKLVKG